MSDAQNVRSASYIAECFWPGVTEADVEAADVRARQSAAALTHEGEPVRYLGSLLFPGDQVVFFRFDAATAEPVRRASERAELPFERIVESVSAAGHPRRSK